MKIHRQDVWNHLAKAHDLHLCDSELDDLIRIVLRFEQAEAIELLREIAKADRVALKELEKLGIDTPTPHFTERAEQILLNYDNSTL